MKNALSFVSEEIEKLQAQHLLRPLIVLESEQGPRVQIAGRSFINLSSNNYLGLNTHPALREAAINATRQFGVGSGAVRVIAGTMTLHEELERRLAAFKHTEAALVFQSGFTANLGVITSLMGEGDLILSDSLNHASIIDGCRLSKAKIRPYPHKDMAKLKEGLADRSAFRRVMIATDGVFSMDGDLAPLPQIVELAKANESFVLVDDAHASGVMGKQGRGTVDHFDLQGQVDIQIGTLSKALGVVGGYVACSQEVRDLLIHRARSFIFTTSHPPAVCAACIAALDLLEKDTDLLRRLWENTRYFKEELEKLGFNTGHSQSPITPVIVGDTTRAMELSDRLFAAGVFAQAIGAPLVAPDLARVRTIVIATHTKEDLQKAAEAFRRIGTELRII